MCGALRMRGRRAAAARSTYAGFPSDEDPTRPGADRLSGTLQWRRDGSDGSPRERPQESAFPAAFDDLGGGGRRRTLEPFPSSDSAEAPRIHCPEDSDDGTWDNDAGNEAPLASSPSAPDRCS